MEVLEDSSLVFSCFFLFLPLFLLTVFFISGSNANRTSGTWPLKSINQTTQVRISTKEKIK